MNQDIRLRSLVAGVICCFLICVMEPVGVLLVHGSTLCADFSTGGAIFLFFILVFGGNVLLGRLCPRLQFTRQELTLVYMMMIVACAIVSWGMMMNLLYCISGLGYYATPANKWLDVVHPHLPPHLVLSDPQAIRCMFEGLPDASLPAYNLLFRDPAAWFRAMSNCWLNIPWGAWVGPLAWWFAFILVVYFLMICVATVFRKQWVENERLLFPLTILPLQMTQEPQAGERSFFGNKMMWLGFAVPAVVHSVNALHNYYNFVPVIQRAFGVSLFARTVNLHLAIYFGVIALSFLLTLDVSLSLWVFAVVAAVQTGIFEMIGFRLGPVQPYSDPGLQSISNQAFGATIVLVAGCFWTARRHLRDVVSKAFRGDPSVDDRNEAVSYRTCVFGLILGNLFVVLWLLKSGLNLSSTLFFGLFAYVVFIGLSRIVAQGGLAYGRAPICAPVGTVFGVGTAHLGPTGITSLGLQLGSWAGDVRTIVMTSAANALKLGDATGTKGRRVFWALLAAMIVALGTTTGAVLLLSYAEGSVNFGGWQPVSMPQYTARWMASLLRDGQNIGWAQFGFMGIGVGVMAALMFARASLLWWPLHPLGFAAGYTWPVSRVWFSVFLGWLMKLLLVKIGGARAYRNAVPFFLGMMLGNFSTAGVWLVIDFFTGMTGNRFTLG